MTNIEKVKKHLKKRKTITSWQAITLYRITRLAAIICDLRKSGWAIESKKMKGKDEDGNATNFVKYVLV